MYLNLDLIWKKEFDKARIEMSALAYEVFELKKPLSGQLMEANKRLQRLELSKPTKGILITNQIL